MGDKARDAGGPPPGSFFYHTLELDGVVVPGAWDLRGRMGPYLGTGAPWTGRRVLEVGPASGYVTLWLEDHGAEVSCLELGPNDPWDFVPHGGEAPPEEYRDSRSRLMAALRLGRDWAFEKAGSTAVVETGPVYDLAEIFEERFDVGVMAMVLLHLARPFEALAALASRCDRLVVTELFPWFFHQPETVQEFFRRPDLEIPPDVSAAIAHQPRALLFAPDGRTGLPKETWWHITPSWTVAALEVLGFRTFDCTYHLQRHDARLAWHPPEGAGETLQPCYTIVADRP